MQPGTYARIKQKLPVFWLDKNANKFVSVDEILKCDEYSQDSWTTEQHIPMVNTLYKVILTFDSVTENNRTVISLTHIMVIFLLSVFGKLRVHQ